MLKIEYIKPEELKPYANNAKLHPAEQVEQIKRSIEEFGFNDPIAVWKDNEIIEGHGRLLASVELGIEEVPIIRLDDLTDEERKAYALVHNKLTMNSGFDFSLLTMELDDLKDFSIDMGEFGFVSSDIYIDNFFEEEEQEEESVDEDEIHTGTFETLKASQWKRFKVFCDKYGIQIEENAGK